MRDGAGILRVEKAHGYVTHGPRLLAFRHRDLLEPGVQIPAGTIRAGEAPEVAVLREVEEETGLVDLVLVGPLGAYDFHADPLMVPAGHEHQRRYAFHLEARGEVRESWVHWERGDGDITPIAFEFYWVPIGEVASLLAPFIGEPGAPILTHLQQRLGGTHSRSV
jgi:8-oxo-dGTP pyrophosphatase MutT (NUDIX family)